MGCGSSKQAYDKDPYAAAPMAHTGPPPQNGYGAPPPVQQQKNGRKEKAVKAGTAAGFLSMLAG